MGKFWKIIAFTACLAVLIGIGMVAVQGEGTLKTSDLDLAYLSRVKKIEISKLRELVKADVTHEYMLEDAFLLKWLLDQDFNVKRTADQIKQHLEWRAKEKIDTILEENWDDMKSRFPISTNTTDKFGRPVIYFDAGQWDVTKLLSEQQESGKDRFERYFYMLAEETEQRIRDLQAEGKNVTQSVSLINLDNFSLEKHGCLQCLLTCRKFSQITSSNYPWLTERKLLVNVPYMFEIVFPYISAKSKRFLNALGRDQSVWEKVVLETIERDQIPSDLLQECSVNTRGLQ